MPTDTRDPLLGETIGEYRIDRVLGRGGMGVVYGAEDTNLGIPVALKMISPQFARSDSFVRRFRSEARAMARISSPHIVRVMAMRQTDEGLFIVMECVSGGTVHDQMDGPLPWQKARPMLVQSLLALEHAHAGGIAHRDIKPRNLMLTDDGVVKVTDFGLAKVLEADPAATVTKGVAGTLLYMSPEQVRADPKLDERTDLFSMGLTAYEMVAGRLPFDREAGEYAVMRSIAESEFPPPSRFEPGISEELDAAIMGALEKDPDKRYPSARAMREAFEAVGADRPPWLGGVPPRAKRRSPEELDATLPPLDAQSAKKRKPTPSRPKPSRSKPSRQKGKAPVGWIAGLGLLLGLAGAGAWWWTGQPGAPPEPATVRVEAGVPGALVFSGDSLLGVVPGPFTLPAGEVRLRAAAGDQQRDTLVSLAPGTTHTLALRLSAPMAPVAPPDALTEQTAAEPDPAPVAERLARSEQSDRSARQPGSGPADSAPPARGTLVAESVSGVSYSVGGSRLEGSARLAPGTHTVRCEAGGQSATQQIRIRSGQSETVRCYAQQEVRIGLQLEGGGFTWATYFINGESVGQVARHLLGPGTHTLDARRSGYTTLDPEQTVTVRPQFSPLPEQRVTFTLREDS